MRQTRKNKNPEGGIVCDNCNTKKFIKKESNLICLVCNRKFTTPINHIKKFNLPKELKLIIGSESHPLDNEQVNTNNSVIYCNNSEIKGQHNIIIGDNNNVKSEKNSSVGSKNNVG